MCAAGGHARAARRRRVCDPAGRPRRRRRRGRGRQARRDAARGAVRDRGDGDRRPREHRDFPRADAGRTAGRPHARRRRRDVRGEGQGEGRLPGV